MQVSGQLEAPAALPPEETLIPIEQEIEWAAELHWLFWRRARLLYLLKIEPQNVQSLARSLHRLSTYEASIKANVIQTALSSKMFSVTAASSCPTNINKYMVTLKNFLKLCYGYTSGVKFLIKVPSARCCVLH